ncbi:copia-like poly, partial [Olea europaea subsp. europaea]
SFIKHLQLIPRPLLMKIKLSTSVWGHAILHAASLVRIKPTAYYQYSPLQLAFGYEPNIFYLRIFGCAFQVPILPSQFTKMGPQRKLGIYVGFDSPSIIRYLEQLTVQKPENVISVQVQTPENVISVGYKLVFVRKRNENNEITNYKTRLVVQDFSQRPEIDYKEIYSPVMDTITFRFLISLTMSQNLDMCLMD